jgi:hypothetical protein
MQENLEEANDPPVVDFDAGTAMVIGSAIRCKKGKST